MANIFSSDIVELEGQAPYNNPGTHRHWPTEGNIHSLLLKKSVPLFHSEGRAIGGKCEGR